jgi:hypothetical protein
VSPSTRPNEGSSAVRIRSFDVEGAAGQADHPHGRIDQGDLAEPDLAEQERQPAQARLEPAGLDERRAVPLGDSQAIDGEATGERLDLDALDGGGPLRQRVNAPDQHLVDQGR